MNRRRVRITPRRDRSRSARVTASRYEPILSASSAWVGCAIDAKRSAIGRCREARKLGRQTRVHRQADILGMTLVDQFEAVAQRAHDFKRPVWAIPQHTHE